MTASSATAAPDGASSPARTPRRRPFLAWLYAPSPSAVIFSLRTTVAACLALAIGFWMELDSPAWACMTVWSVAQNTRGESLSKARWRVIGTITGAVAAIGLTSAAPQAPWMFFPLLALWIALCSGFATFVSNFRAYGLVLAGYTCAIVCTDAAPDGNNVFFLAISRGTYIVLGVLCETFVALLFAAGQERLAHLQIRRKLESALILVSQTLAHIIGEDRNAVIAARNQFGTILSINNQIEFAEVEMGQHGHEGDHARAALAAVSILLSRGFGMATRLQLLTSEHPDFETVADEILGFLKVFPDRLQQEREIPDLLAELQHMRDICRQYAAPHRRTDTPDSLIAVPSSEPYEESAPDPSVEITTSHLDERILFVSLGELLGDLEQAISEYHASMHSIPGDHFQFRRLSHKDPKQALHNGFRSACAVIIASLIYEVTAWPQGLQYIGMTSLVCGLYAVQENPVLGTTNFLKGTIAAWFVAWALSFVFLPMVTTFEGLAVILGVAMFIGGLAKVNPSTAGGGAAYGLLMTSMLGLQNHHFINEISFFNGGMATILAATTSVLVFKTILPFNSADERFRLRLSMLQELRSLVERDRNPRMSTWVGHSTERFSRLIRHAGPMPAPIIEACIQGTLATLTLGLNIIRLRTLMDREYLPESARRPIALVLHYIANSTRRHDRAARIADAAIRRLRLLDTQEHDLVTRLEMTRAITYLVVIAYELKVNKNFLDESRAFRGEEKTLL